MSFSSLPTDTSVKLLLQVADVVKHSSTARGPIRAMSLAPSVRERHVVMCGSVNAANLQARLQEIFHADHGHHNVRWVKVSS